MPPAWAAERSYLPVVPLPTEPGDLTVHLSCTLHEAIPPITEQRVVLYGGGFGLTPRPGRGRNQRSRNDERMWNLRNRAHLMRNQPPSPLATKGWTRSTRTHADADGPGSGAGLLAHLGDARRLLATGYCLITLDAVAQISAPAVFREVLNRIETDPRAFVHGGWRQPAIAALVVAGIFVAAAYLAHTFTWRGAARWAHALRRRLYEHVQRLSMDFFQPSHAGDVAARINQDIERLELTVVHGLGLWWSTIMLVVGISYIVWVDAWMGLWAVGLLSVAAW
jgi:hypothetical protein